jgi:transposase
MPIVSVRSSERTGTSDQRVRTLLYEAANVLLTRYRGKLALKDRALDIGRRSTMRKARIALARRLAIIMHARRLHKPLTEIVGPVLRDLFTPIHQWA